MVGEMSEDKAFYACIRAVHWDREIFPDNKFGECAHCHEKITFRPDAPDDIKKLCLECVHKDMIRAEKEGEEITTRLWNERDVVSVLGRLIRSNKQKPRAN